MRILSGQYKGIQIGPGLGKGVRPTQSRVRKSLFDILGPLDQVHFVDLFSGTGIIGFEAASRGADPVHFVENHRKRLEQIRVTAEKFSKTQFRFFAEDTFHYLNSSHYADIIFADPPYRLLDFREKESLIKLSLEKLSSEGRFILESHGKDTDFHCDQIRTYGDTRLMIWTKHA
ncbi:MAG: methyltransferase [FCB group bacterium]|nr:methyltransferase [FCB group bacterium]